MKSSKVVVVAQMPTPYRIELWDEIEKVLDLHVMCITEKERNREWNVDKRNYLFFLKSFHIFFEKMDWGLHFTLPFSLMYNMFKLKPSIIVIAGYDSMQFWEALIYSKIFNVKVVMWNGTTLLSGRSKNKLVYFLKKIFIKLVDGYYTYGTEATKFIHSFGIKNKIICTGTNTVNIEPYLNLSIIKKDTKKKTFLFVGQLIERKGLVNTFIALSNLKNINWEFFIIGSGSQENELRELAKELLIYDKIFFLGYKQKKEALPYFEKADIFLMPSYNEVWGLVLNEALSSGLFCLSSKFAGSTYDLINNINGYIINPLNIDEYTIYLSKSLEKKIVKEDIKSSVTFTIQHEGKKWVSFLKQIRD